MSAYQHMTTHKGGLTVWRNDPGVLQDGDEIRFEEEGPNTHIANVFRTAKEARTFYEKLTSSPHPNVTHFTEIIEVIPNRHIVAFDKRGKKSLKEYLAPEIESTFFDGIWLTDLTKNLLVDSFSVIRHFMKARVIVCLDTSRLFLVGGRVIFTKFSLSRVDLNLYEYTSVSDLISAIQRALGTTNPDMTKLLSALELVNLANSLPLLCKMPIFWSEADRIYFPNTMWDFVDTGKHKLVLNGISPFVRPLSDVSLDSSLSEWYTRVSVNDKVKKWEEQRKERERKGTSVDMNEVAPRNILCFRRICFGHFRALNDAHLKCNTEKDLAQAFEKFFTDYVWKLYELALTREHEIELEGRPKKLLPVEVRMMNLELE